MPKTDFDQALLDAAGYSTACMNRDKRTGVTPSEDALAAHAIYVNAAMKAGYTVADIQAASLNYDRS